MDATTRVAGDDMIIGVATRRSPSPRATRLTVASAAAVLALGATACGGASSTDKASPPNRGTTTLATPVTPHASAAPPPAAASIRGRAAPSRELARGYDHAARRISRTFPMRSAGSPEADLVKALHLTSAAYREAASA